MKDKRVKIKYDKNLKLWFLRHPWEQTTVMQCEKCGLYYKPILGHTCIKERSKDEY